mgnify:CR=1 FL=1
MEEFDRGIFESIIEKVIVGGYDENGEKDPYKITFIYKNRIYKRNWKMQRSGLENPLVSETKRKKCVPMSVTR